MLNALCVRSLSLILVLCALTSVPVFAQMETATLSGAITDPKGGVVPDVEITATRIETGTAVTTKSNGAGIYVFIGLMPGHYHLMIHKPGFKEIAIKEFELHVQDKLEQNFSLEIGSVSETVTVEAEGLTINSQDATVSTVVDRQFAENLPLNGRSFQTLIYLTPGVVVTPTTAQDNGQFSVNGQRAASNYWTVDGVSANIGVGATFAAGNGIGGAVGSFSALGGTNSLVSLDALQEFRIQTSTFAPEFGRTPGGQISIVTRSGTNGFHGSAFDYLRNDVLDANNWFADSVGLAKAREHQNDFGGTFNGPIIKDHTFFFFSYEGLRLRLPQTALTTVPDLAARQSAVAPMQPFLNAYPLPNGPEVTVACNPASDPTCPSGGQKPSGAAQFNSSYSNPASLDAYSLRVDQKMGGNLSIFGRYNYSPSWFDNRGGGSALSVVSSTQITTQTLTLGGTWAISPFLGNDLRLNYSRVNAQSSVSLDDFGGASAPASLPFADSFGTNNALFFLGINSLIGTSITAGKHAQDIQRQFNIVDGLSWQRGSHSFKVGVDYRRLSPGYSPLNYAQSVTFPDVASSVSGIGFSTITSERGSTFVFHNLGAYAQDSWRVLPRLTLTYGLRWDVDFAPSSNPALPAVTGFTGFNDLSQLALAPEGTSPFKTTFGNVAPRLGVAYQLHSNQEWQSVLRGGFGVFYDLVSSEAGNLVNSIFFSPPYGNQAQFGNVPFPLTAEQSAPVSIPPANLENFAVYDPYLKLPYTLEWNVAFEQALGSQQAISVTYVGASGQRLLQSTVLLSPQPTLPVPNFVAGTVVGNTSESSYNALQLQFQRRLSHGLQGLASYTFSHSLDSASAGSFANGSNLGGGTSAGNWGSSDFDIRHAFTAGLTYDIPLIRGDAFRKALFGGWSIETLILARSAPPIDIADINFFQLNNSVNINIRPDVVPGQPFYLYGSEYPGGKALNPAAFQNPPVDPVTLNPTRQGNLSRNFLRGFGATQWDFAVHRNFPIRESFRIEFRAEMFNILNHPNFGPPDTLFGTGGFGLATQTLAQSLTGANSTGAGGLNPLYQIGGPRSIQLALKAVF